MRQQDRSKERIDNERRALVSLRVMRPDDRKSASNMSQARWLAYATAAAASGLSMACPAEGEVHYSGILDVKFDNGIQNHRFPLTEGASLDFFRSYSGVYLLGASCGVRHAAVSNAVRDQTYSRAHFADRLDHGQPVSSGSFFGHRGRDVSAVIVIYDSASNYPWGRPGTGFIGFRFNTGAGTQYAWARVKMHHGAAVVDYAWADPGESLAAGQTSSSGDQVSALPDLDSLGTLAFGAKGVIAWRQARAKADSAPALPMNPNR